MEMSKLIVSMMINIVGEELNEVLSCENEGAAQCDCDWTMTEDAGVKSHSEDFRLGIEVRRSCY